MPINRFGVAAALAVLATLPTASGAFATCAGALAANSKWHLHALEASPDSGAGVIQCLMTFHNNGNFTAPCTVYNVGSSTAVGPVSVTGRIILNAQCNFTGTINIPSDPQVVIKTGHLNDNVGAGTAIQDTGVNTQVIHFTLVKQ